MKLTVLAVWLQLIISVCAYADNLASGDLGVVIEREKGRVALVNTTQSRVLAEIDGLGDLSHASVVYSRDQRYAYVFGRDGGLSKVDLLNRRVEKRVIQAGNSIGGAISQDGKVIAVSNYQPGGVKLFDAETLETLADLPALYGEDGQRSKVVGLVDAPGHKFVCSLFEGGEIWLIDARNPRQPQVSRFKDVGKQPYDALLTPDGRYYIAGLFGEPGLVKLDLWQPEDGVQHILEDYGKDDEEMPVYKMPHLEGWTVAGDWLLVPAIGHSEVLAIDRRTWRLEKRIPVAGQPVFVMARPDGRQVWVNFAYPNNGKVQVIDVKTLDVITSLQPGKGVMHMEFTPRGDSVWMAVRDEDKVLVFDTETFAETARMSVDKPSGIFFSSRAHKLGL